MIVVAMAMYAEAIYQLVDGWHTGFILETEIEGGISPLHLQHRRDFQNIGGTSLEPENTTYST